MSEIKPHNFWYAVNNTEVIVMPKHHLETFGSTNLHYHLVSELMDTVNRIRIREGAIQSRRPQIITPTCYTNEMLEGFGEEANQYVDWLRTHAMDLRILQYGFKIQKTELSEHVVSGNVKEIVEQVKKQIADKNDPMTAVIYGVDDPWDVCLLKFMVDVIRNSAPHNFNELGRRLGLTSRAVEKNLSRLKRYGLIRRLGPDKGGRWEVKHPAKPSVAGRGQRRVAPARAK